MSSRGGDALVFKTMTKANAKNASYDEGKSKEEDEDMDKRKQ